jgi:UDP-glucose 4-epimerase
LVAGASGLVGSSLVKMLLQEPSYGAVHILDFVIPAKYKAIHVDKVAMKMIEQALKDETGLFVIESDKLQ